MPCKQTEKHPNVQHGIRYSLKTIRINFEKTNNHIKKKVLLDAIHCSPGLPHPEVVI